MKSRIICCIACGIGFLQGLIFCSVAFAQTKYGVVDMQQVILSVDEGKKEREKLEKEIKSKEAEFDKTRKELEKLNEEWKSQVLVLSEEAKLKKQQEFQEKFLNLKNAEMEFQKEIKRKEQKATQNIAMKVVKIAEEIAKEKGLEAVFEVSTSGILYLKDPIDLTNEVIARYDKDKPKAENTNIDNKKGKNKK